MKRLTADHVYSLIEKMTKEERQLLAKRIGEEHVLLAWEVGEASHWAMLVEGYAEICQNSKKWLQKWKKAAIKMAQEIDRRTRKNSPETVKQNVQICELRKQDRKKWSLGALAKNFGMRRQSIDIILKNEAKWRQLFSKLPTE